MATPWPSKPCPHFRPEELEFLSAWAREERAVDPYFLPAHQLQAAHGVKGVALIRLIKVWAGSEGRRDEEIFDLRKNPNPRWPWSDDDERLINLAQNAPSKHEE